MEVTDEQLTQIKTKLEYIRHTAKNSKAEESIIEIMNILEIPLNPLTFNGIR